MKYVIKELSRHKWRSLANISGYAISILFILVVMSVTISNQRDSTGILKSTGTHFIVYAPKSNSCCANSDSVCKNPGPNEGFFADGVSTEILNHSLINTIERIQGVRSAAPFLLYHEYTPIFKRTVSLGGIDTSSYATRTNACAVTNLIDGKFITSDPTCIVAEESFAKAYQLHVGDSLNIFSQQFKLIGIINSGVKPAKADFYAPIEHVKSILKGKLPRLSQGFDVNIILVEVADARNQEKVINAVKSTMQNPSILGYNCYEPARKAISIIERASILINILISLFLIIFATKTQLSALTKRLQEIGILKSLGWSDKRLARQIIISSTIQAMIGAIAGCLLAFLAASLLNAFKINIIEATSINIQFSKIVLVMGLSILGGLIACVFPIIKIIQLKPGEILQTYN